MSRSILSVSLGTILLFLSSISFTADRAHAQTKIAYLDASKILKRMPEAIDAQSRLDQLVSGWTRDADEMQNELSRKQTDYERRKLIMTDAERTSIEVDLQNLKKKLDDFRHSKYDSPNGELFSQEAQLMKSAYDRLGKAIEDAAHDGGYDYVLDRSSKDIPILYSNSKYDLTINVARRLGIETDILSTPLLNGPKPGGAPGGQPGMPPNGQPQQPPPQTFPPQGTNGNPQNQPGSFNSGGYNPDQQPQPAGKTTTTPEH